jgi:pilus assembly protein CpaE
MSVEDYKRQLKLVVIDSQEDTAQTIRSHFADAGIRLVGETIDLRAGLRMVRGLMPDLLLLEMPANQVTQTLEAIQRVRAEQPHTGIILSSYEVSPNVILESMRAGAQEFVSRPVDPTELGKAFDHIRKMFEHVVSTRTRRSTVISLFSSKGGVGGSMVSANLAVALAQRTEARVALIDLNFQMGDLSLMLDIKPRYTLADTAEGSALEEGELRSMLTAHNSGVSLLSAVASPEDGEKVERNHLVEVFGLLNTMFDYIVVDVERHIDDRTLEVLDLSDRILLVSSLSLPSIRNAKRYFELFGRLDIDETKFELVVNRHNTKKGGGLRIRDLEGAVGLKISWLVPNDYQVANHSIDAGVPLVSGAPRSKIAKSFHDYVDALVEAVEAETESDAATTAPNTVTR